MKAASDMARAATSIQKITNSQERRGNAGPAIQVDCLRKSFLTPQHKVHTLKETVLHPFRKYSIEHMCVLEDVSFSVIEGEFFGIIGRNGSGKSTLLKCLAGIYSPEAGAINIDGRLSPFIELGVGFNPDLNAKDNILVNAALLGVSPKEARRRFDDIIAFAELEDYVDLKFKNYSSGMQVRLGFASAIQADANILLVDEVLAVGDTSFQQKCFDTFRRMKREGRTIVFVSHDMDSIQRFCDRVLYFESGQIREIGEPASVVSTYMSDTVERQRDRNAKERAEKREWITKAPSLEGTYIEKVQVCDRANNESSIIQQDEHMYIKTVIKLGKSVENPELRVKIHADDRYRPLLFAACCDLIDDVSGEPAAIQTDMHLHCLLTNGPYLISLSLEEDGKVLDEQRYTKRFSVQGGVDQHGFVMLPHKFESKLISSGA